VASRAHRQRGQASVELLGALPLIVLATVAVAQVVLTGWTVLAADRAAGAGAVAMARDADGQDAAERALPDALRGRARVVVDDSERVVRVTARPPWLLPGVRAPTLSAEAAAP
jgi:pilus assembly protein CpaE